MQVETRQLLEELLLNTFSMVLATIDEDNLPSLRSVFNLRCEKHFPHSSKVIKNYDDKPHNMYISTNTSSNKIKHISRNDNVALYFTIAEPGNVKGIMLQGKAEIIDDIEFKKTIWEDDWKEFYPKGYSDPDFTMLKVNPKFLKGWHKGHHKHRF